MEDLFSCQLELLKKEMEMLQNGIRGYDTILFTIKGWAITVFSAMVLFAVDKQKPYLYWFCIASVLAFWFIDAFYKDTQNRLIERYRKVENFVRSSNFELVMLNRDFGDFDVPFFGEGFYLKRKMKLRYVILSTAIRIHTCLLYVFLLIMCFGLIIIR